MGVVAEIHRTTLEPTKLELLTSWLPQQRWYAAKGRIPSLRKLGGFRLDDPAGEVGIEVMVVADESGEQPVVYQVPMTYRAAPLPGADGALIGTTEHGVLGRRWVYDAPHDDVYVGQLLALVQGQTQAQAQSESHTSDPTVEGHAVDADVVTLATSSVLRGEQSNTSVVCQVVDATGAASKPVIIKVFRSLHPGENPDVVVQSALTEAGSTQVPHTVGSVSGEWADPVSGERVRGHLAFAQRFLPGVEDAWRVALRAATAGEDFTEPARELGAATAQIHLSLADALGTAAADDDVKAELVRIIRSRYDAAVAEVPSLAAYDAVVAASLDDLAARDWPELQRIHGDYHLGQVLRTADGWVAVDFEGEPLRPLPERVRPDLALRDVAGMLRSFDYVGGSVELAEPEPIRPRLGGRHPRGVPSGLHGGDPPRPARDRAGAARARARQGPLRGQLRGPQPPQLAGHPDGRHRAAGLRRRLRHHLRHHLRHELRHQLRHHLRHVRRAGRCRPEGSLMTTVPTIAEIGDLGPLQAFIEGRNGQPHDFLGHHLGPGGLTITAYRPLARAVRARLADGAIMDLGHVRDGVWTGTAPDVTTTTDYRLLVTWGDGVEHEQDDPYRFAPTLGQLDLHLFNEGRHERLWTVLGSHVRRYSGPLGEVDGRVLRRLGAARRRRSTSSATSTAGTASLIRCAASGQSGVWELFIPGAAARHELPVRHPRRGRARSSTPTRWPSAPRSRRSRPPSSTSPTTGGATTSGASSARRTTRTPAR